MKEVIVYYTIIKPSPAHLPNRRAYYISRWVGNPFMEFDLPSDITIERIKVEDHLGLHGGQIEWRNHRGNRAGKTNR